MTSFRFLTGFTAGVVGTVAAAGALALGAAGTGRPAPADTRGEKAPPGAVRSEEPDAVIPLAEYRERRRELVRRLRGALAMGERGVFVWRTGRPSVREERFHPDTNFFYLTGWEEPGAALVLSFTASTDDETLLLPERDRAEERWIGRRLGPGGINDDTGEPDEERRHAMTATGFDAVAPVSQMDRLLEGRTGLAGAAVCWLRHDSGGLSDEPTSDQRFLEIIRSRYPKVRLVDPGDELARMRLVKSAAELALMEQAISITVQAHLEAMRQARSFRHEYEVQGVIEGSFYRQGALGPAFFSIVGAGKNGTVLHYTKNRGPIASGDLVLVDIGAEVGRYCADLTRTWPASGRFSPRQRTVYELVRKAQSDAAALLRPGVTITEVHAKAKEVLEAAGMGAYFTHGTSHFLGLDVHDPGSRDWPLPAGAVVTVEPGIYLPDEGIGVRIEDDYLITETGARKLSQSLPSAPDEIERLQRGAESVGKPTKTTENK